MKNLNSPFLSDYKNVVNLFRPADELNLVLYNWLDNNQVEKLESLSLSLVQLVEETFNIWPECIFVDESEPYIDLVSMYHDVYVNNVIKISQINNPDYVSEKVNCFIRLAHDIIHLQAFRQYPLAGTEFNTNTELLTYAITTNLVLNSNWNNEDKELFLNYHYSDFVAQTLWYEKIGGYMPIQMLMIPYQHGYNWRSFINLPTTELI